MPASPCGTSTAGSRASTASSAGIVTVLGLNLGAPLFFVISGYCIASSLDSSRRKGTPPTRFLARRLWRIFPPYWASVAVIALLVMALDRLGLAWLHRTAVGLELASPFDLNRAQWFGNLTLTETWRPLVGGIVPAPAQPGGLGALLPGAVLPDLLPGAGLRPEAALRALGAATVAIVGLRLFLWDSGRLGNYLGLFPDLWHEFAVGLALYWRINVARSGMGQAGRRAGPGHPLRDRLYQEMVLDGGGGRRSGCS